MVKRLLVLVGMLAVMLAAAVPTFAQQQGPITATSVLGPPDTSGPNPEPTYPLIDEETGTTYEFTSGYLELEPYVGQRVTIEGVRIPGIDPLAPNATRIQPVDGAPPDPITGTRATFDFELTVEGGPPAGARFFGAVPAEGCISVPLADPDADGLYTGSLDVPRFPPGTRPLRPDAEPVSLPVQMVQGTGTQGSDKCDFLRPGEPTSVIRDFGPVRIEDQTLSASVSFDEDRGGNTTPGSGDGTSDEGGSDGGPLVSTTSGIRSLLSGTGGAATLALIGAGILLAGGLLIRRLFR
jgi:hypothetical protein